MDELVLLAVRTDDSVTITVTGELDIATAPALTAFLLHHVHDGDLRLDLEVGDLTFIGATGLGLLVALRTRMDRQHTLLVLTGASPRLRRLLELTGLDTRFTLTPLPVAAAGPSA